MVLLQGVFTIAIEWGETDSNPVSVVRKPRQGARRVVQPITPEGVERIRASFVGEGDLRSATLVSVLAYAGLRPGEALALDFGHVRASTILVERAVTDGEFKVQKTGRIYRTVDLLGVLAEDLAAWQELRGPTGLLFSKPTASRGAAMTGTTGATAASSRRRATRGLVVRGRMTCAIRSRR